MLLPVGGDFQALQTPSASPLQTYTFYGSGPLLQLSSQAQLAPMESQLPGHQQPQLPPQHSTQINLEPREPPLPYLVQTPSSSLSMDLSFGATGATSGSHGQPRGSMDTSSPGGGGGGDGGAAAIAPNFSGVSGGISEYDGDGCGCWSSALSISVPPPPPRPPQQGFGSDGAHAAAPPLPLPPQLLQWPAGALVTTDGSGTVVWAPVARLPPPPAAAAAAAATPSGMATGPSYDVHSQRAQVQTLPPASLLPLMVPSETAAGVAFQASSAPGLQPGLGLLGLGQGPGPGPGPGPGSAVAAGPAQAQVSEQARGPGPEPTAQLPAAAVGGGWGTVAGAAGAGVAPRGMAPPFSGAGAAAAVTAAAAAGAGAAVPLAPASAQGYHFGGGGLHAAAADRPAPAGTAAAAVAAAGAVTAAAVAATAAAGGHCGPTLRSVAGQAGPAAPPPGTVAAAAATTTSGGVSGAALLAQLVAEAAAGGWAAVATGLAPLPPAQGRTAEELLAGLDLQEVFAPPKPSHAKRIRGHVRRAADLKAALADRVRAIQRLAAQNADLRGRAKVLELVVRCRDEQLRLLRNHRTSADGRVYYVEQLGVGMGGGAGGAAGVGGGGEGGGEGGGGGGGALVPYIGTNAAALATMPATELLQMFRRIVADVSASLAAVENRDESASPAAAEATDPRNRKPTRGWSQPSPPPDDATAPVPAPVTAGPEAGVGHSGGDNAAMQLAMTMTTGTLPGPVVAAAAGGGASVGRPGSMARLRGQMALFRNLLRYLGLVNEEACKFADTTLTGETAAPEPGHWLRVVMALGLNQQQLADAAALHTCWQDWLARIHAERRSVTSALDALLSINRYGATYLESVGRYGTDRDAIHKIHANVMRERILLVLTGEVFCCHILTDIQWARAIVHSYPYILDVWELVRAASQLYYATTRGLMSASLSSS
ncbi:hypothetical protein PLESTM_000961400 [Pleodorina starrii]|nr:hypothetical protein PLESTM_000961400 [Pleodorina starrii]